jgi:predicted 2-oxoglutarate/Fe(II)-dependent dioxygenase YbiX
MTAGTGPVRGGYAPVLVIPGVLDRDHCRRLIRHWETSEKIRGAVSTQCEGSAVKATIKVRDDVPILGPELLDPLRQAFLAKVLPEIQRAFQFRVTQVESMRIGCYDAASSGFFGPHRDNTTPYTAHRKFALTLNLNTGEYEGGELRFPECGETLFAPEAGGAVVFSCSLLHEALRVRNGRRFGLFTFFFDDVGAEQVRRMLADEARKRPGVTPEGMIAPG